MTCILQSDYLAMTYAALFNIFLSLVYHAMDAVPNLKPPDIAAYLQILETVRDSGLLERFDVDISQRIRDIQEQVKSVSSRWYEERKRDLNSTPGVNIALLMLEAMDIASLSPTPAPSLGSREHWSLGLLNYWGYQFLMASLHVPRAR